MIIIAYLFLLHPGEYTASKSERLPFFLEETVFSYSRSVFESTATEGNLQAAKLFCLIFMT